MDRRRHFSGVVATTLWFTVRWIPHCMLLIPSAIAVIAVPVTGNAGQGPDHDYTTSSVIVFALALSLLVGSRRPQCWRHRAGNCADESW